MALLTSGIGTLVSGISSAASAVGSVVSAVAPYAAVAGTALSAVQGYQSAKSQEEAARYNAKLQAANAKMVRQQGLAAEEQQRQQARQIMSRSRAAAIESGTYSGTTMDVLGNAALGAELDALNTRYSYNVRANDYMAQSYLSNYQAQAYKGAATSQLVGGALNTFAVGYDKFGPDNTSRLNKKNPPRY